MSSHFAVAEFGNTLTRVCGLYAHQTCPRNLTYTKTSPMAKTMELRLGDQGSIPGKKREFSTRRLGQIWKQLFCKYH